MLPLILGSVITFPCKNLSFMYALRLCYICVSYMNSITAQNYLVPDNLNTEFYVIFM